MNILRSQFASLKLELSAAGNSRRPWLQLSSTSHSPLLSPFLSVCLSSHRPPALRARTQATTTTTSPWRRRGNRENRQQCHAPRCAPTRLSRPRPIAPTLFSRVPVSLLGLAPTLPRWLTPPRMPRFPAPPLVSACPRVPGLSHALLVPSSSRSRRAIAPSSSCSRRTIAPSHARVPLAPSSRHPAGLAPSPHPPRRIASRRVRASARPRACAPARHRALTPLTPSSRRRAPPPVSPRPRVRLSPVAPSRPSRRCPIAAFAPLSAFAPPSRCRVLRAPIAPSSRPSRCRRLCAAFAAVGLSPPRPSFAPLAHPTRRRRAQRALAAFTPLVAPLRAAVSPVAPPLRPSRPSLCRAPTRPRRGLRARRRRRAIARSRVSAGAPAPSSRPLCAAFSPPMRRLLAPCAAVSPLVSRT
ncbi:hypothetical protein DENSPDRAFT_887397 [Dentipellis sp. KUC8613]|nr:hypothetical protein DENSPDRAFT_887397 [Dentipellis sp. KUC8613]